MQITVQDWLQAADHEVEMRRWRDQSGGKTRQFVVEHELKGVAPESLRWYYMNFDSESYRMWHPCHIGLQWEKKVAGPGACHIAWEKIGGKLAAYRLRVDPLDKAPVAPRNPAAAIVITCLDTQGEPLWQILSEYAPGPEGTIKRSTFVFPAATPDEFVESHRQHAIEENPGMAYKAVPYLIQKTFGHMVEPKKLKELGLVVAAPMD